MIAWEDPDYDYRSGKTFLFKGLQKAGLRGLPMRILRPLRPSGRDQLQRRAAPARSSSALKAQPATRSTTAISMPRISIRG